MVWKPGKRAYVSLCRQIEKSVITGAEPLDDRVMEMYW